MRNYPIILKISLIVLLISSWELKAQCITDSIINYEHKLFQADSTDEAIHIYYEYVQYLKRIDNREQLEPLLTEVYNYQKSHERICDSTNLRLLYEIQLASFYAKDYSRFSWTYNQIQYCSTDFQEVRRFSEYFNILLYIELHEWQEAEKRCLELWPEEQSKIESIFLPTSLIKEKSIKKAKRLSWFPGLGQYYNGYTKEAITSFLSCSATGSLVIASYGAEMYYLSALGFFPIFIRFMIGGRAYAVKQAEIHNQQMNSEVVDLVTKDIMTLINRDNKSQ